MLLILPSKWECDSRCLPYSVECRLYHRSVTSSFFVTEPNDKAQGWSVNKVHRSVHTKTEDRITNLGQKDHQVKPEMWSWRPRFGPWFVLETLHSNHWCSGIFLPDCELISRNVAPLAFAHVDRRLLVKIWWKESDKWALDCSLLTLEKYLRKFGFLCTIVVDDETLPNFIETHH